MVSPPDGVPSGVEALPSALRNQTVTETPHASGRGKKGVPEGLWIRCGNAECGATLFRRSVESNLWVCPQCQHHFRINADTRIEPHTVLVLAGTREQLDEYDALFEAVGAKVELISLTRHVVYTDLNLARHADVMTLEQRVNDVAKEACEQLAQMYPLSDPNTPNCVEQALRSAKGQIDEVVAAAEKEPRH